MLRSSVDPRQFGVIDEGVKHRECAAARLKLSRGTRAKLMMWKSFIFRVRERVGRDFARGTGEATKAIVARGKF